MGITNISGWFYFEMKLLDNGIFRGPHMTFLQLCRPIIAIVRIFDQFVPSNCFIRLNNNFCVCGVPEVWRPLFGRTCLTINMP